MSWVNDNFAALLRKGLPREGGTGGERYTYSDFRLTADAKGNAVGFVHIKPMNYAYFDVPDPKWDNPFHMRQVDVWKGTVEQDVTTTITPQFVSGLPATITAVSIAKTREAGPVRIWNDALPKIWFSLDRKLHTAENKANAASEEPMLDLRPDPEVEAILKSLLARKLVVAEQVRFGNSEKGLTLTATYGLASGFKAYSELLAAYNRFRRLPGSEKPAH